MKCPNKRWHQTFTVAVTRVTGETKATPGILSFHEKKENHNVINDSMNDDDCLSIRSHACSLLAHCSLSTAVSDTVPVWQHLSRRGKAQWQKPWIWKQKTVLDCRRCIHTITNLEIAQTWHLSHFQPKVVLNQTHTHTLTHNTHQYVENRGKVRGCRRNTTTGAVSKNTNFFSSAPEVLITRIFYSFFTVIR